MQVWGMTGTEAYSFLRKKRFLRKAFPEPVFRYFSKA